MPRLHYPNSPEAELKEVLQASQGEVNCCVPQPPILWLQLSLQASFCGWARDGYLILILSLKEKERKKNYLRIEQILCSGGMLWLCEDVQIRGEGDWSGLPALTCPGRGRCLSPKPAWAHPACSLFMATEFYSPLRYSMSVRPWVSWERPWCLVFPCTKQCLAQSPIHLPSVKGPLICGVRRTGKHLSIDPLTWGLAPPGMVLEHGSMVIP